MSDSPSFQFYRAESSSIKSLMAVSENFFIKDLVSSDQYDAEKPITSGIYHLQKGAPVTYTFPCHETKVVLDGEFDITDTTGKWVHAVRGDVVYFPKGIEITLETASFGLAFYTGQRGSQA